MQNVDHNQANIRSIFLYIVVPISILMTIYSFEVGAMGDHRHYIEQWQMIVEGGNPWSTDNTYGPVHSVMGYFTLIHPLAPKIFMVILLLCGNFYFLYYFISKLGIDKHIFIYALAIPTNVLFISLTFVHAMNDMIAAALISIAIVARFRNRDIFVGFLIAFAALTKYYPILILPFFSIDRVEFRWRILLSGIIFFVSGMLISYFVWGQPMIDAVLYGGSRGASGYSILLDLSRYGFDNYIISFLGKYNALAVFLFVLGAFGFARILDLNWLESSVIGYLTMLIIYKVGHSQFFLPWLYLVSALPLLNMRRAEYMTYLFLPTILYLSYYQFSMDLGTNLLGNRPYWIEFYAGFVSAPFFIAPLILVVIYLAISQVSQYNQNRQSEMDAKK